MVTVPHAKIHGFGGDFGDTPELAAAHGAALRQAGQLEEAIAEFRETIRLEPDRAAAHGNLGNALLRQGKLEEASAEYREAIRIKPDDAAHHYSLGNALNNQGKLEEAITCYRQAIRLQPNFPEAHNNLGQETGEVEQALDERAESRTHVHDEHGQENRHHVQSHHVDEQQLEGVAEHEPE